jgi:hypothetical protein
MLTNSCFANDKAPIAKIKNKKLTIFNKTEQECFEHNRKPSINVKPYLEKNQPILQKKSNRKKKIILYFLSGITLLVAGTVVLARQFQKSMGKAAGRGVAQIPLCIIKALLEPENEKRAYPIQIDEKITNKETFHQSLKTG